MENEKIDRQEDIDYNDLAKAIGELMKGKSYKLQKMQKGKRYDAILWYGDGYRKRANIEIKYRYKDEKTFRDTIIQLNKYQELGRRYRENNEQGYVFVFYPQNNSYYLYNLTDMDEYFFNNQYTVDYVWIDEYDESRGKHWVTNMHLDLNEKHRHEFDFSDKITKQEIKYEWK